MTVARRRVGRAFYAHPALAVAEGLLGRMLVFESDDGPLGGRIVEVEAYGGDDDPASHAYSGRTARNATMWGPPGHAYVYFTYGMHHCVNLVTGDEGVAAAVLIRAMTPEIGVETMHERRPHLEPARLLSGPGRVCAGLGITREHDGLDLVRGPLYVGAGGRVPARIARGPRIGIRRGLDRRWRLWVAGNASVSAGDGARAPPGMRREPRDLGRRA